MLGISFCEIHKEGINLDVHLTIYFLDYATVGKK